MGHLFIIRSCLEPHSARHLTGARYGCWSIRLYGCVSESLDVMSVGENCIHSQSHTCAENCIGTVGGVVVFIVIDISNGAGIRRSFRMWLVVADGVNA